MSTLCNKADPQDISRWPLSWRLEGWGSPVPPHHLAQMRALSGEAAARVWKLILDLGLHDEFPFKRGLFESVQSLSLQPVSHQDDLAEERPRVKKWLFAQGVPFRRQVYLSYQPDTAVLTTWKMLIRYWDLFYYSISDDLTVIDETLNWALLFYHEHEVYFGSRIPKDQKSVRPKGAVPAPGPRTK